MYRCDTRAYALETCVCDDETRDGAAVEHGMCSERERMEQKAGEMLKTGEEEEDRDENEQHEGGSAAREKRHV